MTLTKAIVVDGGDSSKLLPGRVSGIRCQVSGSGRDQTDTWHLTPDTRHSKLETRNYFTLGLYLLPGPRNEIRENFRVDYESIERLSALPEHARCGRHQNHLVTGAGRTVQPELCANQEGFGLLWRVWCTRCWLLRRRFARIHHKHSRIGQAASGWHCRRGTLGHSAGELSGVLKIKLHCSRNFR